MSHPINSRRDNYNKALAEYEDLDRADKVPESELLPPPSQHFYLPAHGMVKDSTTMTKLRVVFDASAKITTVNDTLLPTPSLYPLLTTILNRFRLHYVALTSDISKMFQEVVLDLSERNYLR